MSQLSEIGIIGISVMGQGLVRNLARNDVKVSIYNRSYERIEKFLDGKDEDTNIVAFREVADFVKSLSRPRKIGMLVKAGRPTDSVIEMIAPLLEPGDILMDIGNSFYEDTERREALLQKQGIQFLGIGISGGEKGALEGPSIMAGGNHEAWETVRQILTQVAAKTEDGSACCEYFGGGGAGHFVKMVHNGIEYAYMGVISEIYQIMRDSYGLSIPETAEIFENLDANPDVASYLIEITSKILRVKDDMANDDEVIDGAESSWLIDKIDDVAGNKGTGKWTSETALRMGVAVPTLTQALYSRYLSERKRFFKINLSKDSQKRGSEQGINLTDMERVVKDGLRFSQYICFEQGLNLIAQANKLHGWEIDLAKVLNVWRSGCIIRTAYISAMVGAYESNRDIISLLDDRVISSILAESRLNAGLVVTQSVEDAVPIPCLGSAVAYFDTLTSNKLPTAMIQAQRDYFGAHTYKRTDRDGTFHTDWESIGNQ